METEENVGVIRIADEVVSIIAGLAATEIEGVAGMSGGLLDGGFAEMLGNKNLSKGVKVEVGETETAVDLYIIVEYGVKIADVAWEVQQNVKKAIESMTGLDVVEANVHIEGISFKDEEEEEDNDETEEEDEVTEVPRVR
ncbi:Asp23/Gls24 family envelope stress response protein [Halanaerobacter jeridensis]|uniref:Alkaline shock family protein YloU n=1 Tax=Halanaerobacter jeridensis TaxID=706427 RepID=A0A939BQT2_9FIRM|nr:Asp23/Gls24 family envelope stress response protein [Halanaerobacter jeridensis]MBM7555231.1 putative alkaline shock family protein YloU [Halanaerobacter jeridensis]